LFVLPDLQSGNYSVYTLIITAGLQIRQDEENCRIANPAERTGYKSGRTKKITGLQIRQNEQDEGFIN